MTHHLCHTQLCHSHTINTIFHTPSLSHTIFHTPLCHTPSFTHHFFTHYLSHTTLSHTIFHITFSHTICHTPSLSHAIFHTLSFTHRFVTHHLSHITLSPHTIFHTPLCDTPSFTAPFVTHHLSQHFVTDHLSHTLQTIFHTPSLPHTIFATHHLSHTTLSHTIFDTTSLTHTIFHTHRHRPFFTHHLSHTTLSHTIFDTPSFTHNFVTHHLSPHHLSQTIFHHTIFHADNFVTHHLSSTSSFVFPSFPVPATTFLAHYWKKLTCGVIQSFYFSLCIRRSIRLRAASVLASSHHTHTTTHLTALISHHSSHSIHLTPLITQHSSDTIHHSTLISYPCHTAAGFRVAGAVRRAFCRSCGKRSTQSLLEELLRAWAPLGRGSLSCGRRSTQSLLAFVWQAQRHWAAAGFRVAGAVQRAFWRLLCGRRAFVWQAQYTEPSGGAAARVGVAGPRLPFVYSSFRVADRLLCGRRNTQSLLEELLRAWAPGRGWLSCGRRSTQNFLEELLRAWAPLGRGWLLCGFCVANGLSWERRVHRVSWRRCCARGRRWAAAGFCVADGLSWERCSTQSLLEELLRAWAPLGRGLTCGVIRSFYFIFVQYSKYCASFLEGLGSVK